MISYLINVKSSMSFGEELYACAVMWSFLSLFFVLLLHSYVKKKNQKLKVSRVMLFRFFYGLIMFYTIGPAMVFVDFMVIWFTGMISPLAGLWLKLLGNPVYLPEDSTKTLIVFLKCKKCNVNISEFDRVCPKCGEPTDNYDYMGKCKSCMHFFKIGEQVCPNCGHEVVSPSSIILMNKIPELTIKPNNSETANTVAVSNVAASATTPPVVSTVQYASKSDYNNNYSAMSEDALLKDFIQKELIKHNMNDLKKPLPKSVYRKKLLLNILFIILLFFFNVLIFFHFDLYIYIVYAIILIILFILTKKFNIMNFYVKEIKSRPSEKISNIVLSSKNDFVSDKSRFILLIGFLLCIFIPAVYFREPRIFYEHRENGYVVRFYTLGLTGNEKAVIPDTYNDEPVVEIRGNVFKNMFLLKEVELPDTVTEIRGSTFENDISLEKVKLPSNLVRIGASAFKNCKSLQSIEIPYKVTRIAAHAFRGCSSLSNVLISSYSQLKEIGSSAFRDCYKLRNINLPRSTVIDQRSFKNSNTNIIRFDSEIIDDNGNVNKNNMTTASNTANISLNSSVYFSEKKLKVSYSKLTNNIATFDFDSGTETGTVEYELSNTSLYYIFGTSIEKRYIINISKNGDETVTITIEKMNEYGYGFINSISHEFKANESFEIRTDNTKSIVFKVGELPVPVNKKYSFDVYSTSEEGDNVITISNENYKYYGPNFMIYVYHYSEYSNYAVIYLN